ncbi:flagellar motor protein [Psychrobium sp. 1_MG-2023]|uniref:flagellar motor protein n=1 Tax=Psychrobium sp. 1_MG-2023 TaxID=3062624 RepID=UPI000C336ED8|nr:flagellar motor protein [Psychrobium sp. 1_MG-2023]MDP2559816.1 flagellar motor protein [Psychrobium sp. 1_MG-2023]PKF59078.1 flagellar motor protein [Alteromonadales bacterium alter-6D02]
MDRLSIFGLVLAFVAILGGQLLEGGALATLYNGPALLIVLVGTLAAVMIQTPWHQFVRSFTMLKWVVFPPEYDVEERINTLLRWGHISRAEGFLPLENELDNEKDPLIRECLMLLIDGAEVEHIRETIETRIYFQRDEYGHSAKVYEAMGGYSPTLGILGAVLGLIQSMQYLDQPTQLGGGIATAFVATIYGVGFANLIYLPIHYKLRRQVFQTALYYEMILEGVLLINRGENPNSIERRLEAYKIAYAK